MKRLVFLILCGILLLSCGKKRSIHITAANVVTGQRYAGLEYTVGSSVTKNDGEEFRTEASGVLDANGEVGLTIKVKPNRTYHVFVKQPANSCYNNTTVMYFNSPYDKDGHFSFEFAPCANLKLGVHNTNCIDSTDNIKFRRLWLNVNGSYDYVERNGCFQFDGDYFKLPIGSYRYEWIVTKNGITTHHESSFQLTEGQYYDFQLDY